MICTIVCVLFLIFYLPSTSSVVSVNPYVFDTNGRLPQVDAAFEAAAKGGTVLALKGSESIVILTHSYQDDNFSIQTTRSRQKVRLLCSSIAYCASGITTDSQYVSSKMFEKISDSIYSFGTDPSIYRLAKEAADLLHMRTLTNQRPLGIRAIFMGFAKINSRNNNTLALIEVDPIGNMHQCKLSSLGISFLFVIFLFISILLTQLASRSTC
jgi:20S proteasome alpha/beta subunit